MNPSPRTRQATKREPDSRRIGHSVQYWTPDDPNAWVGDVALGLWRGRLHVFYLFDRRHHASGGGAGRHFFAHLSSANLAAWDEHPPAVPIDEWWETLGTGTPFVFKGKLHLAYGLHTNRLTKDPSVPRGATYVTSEDGIHFVKSRLIVHPTENPTIYNRADGALGTKLVSEIAQPTAPETFVAQTGRPFRLVFGRKGGCCREDSFAAPTPSRK